MAYRSDTNNRNTPNTWEETILDGEINGYDRSLSFPYSQDIDDLRDDLSDLEVEISKDNSSLRDRAKILYTLEDQEQIYSSIR